MTIEATVPANQQELAVQIAHDYLQSFKHWSKTDYDLQLLRSEGNPASPVIVLDAVHHDDLSPRGRESSRSVQLQIDLLGRRVLKELAYQ